jgi:hypothetical protein
VNRSQIDAEELAPGVTHGNDEPRAEETRDQTGAVDELMCNCCRTPG